MILKIYSPLYAVAIVLTWFLLAVYPLTGISKLVAITWLALLSTVPMIFADEAANTPTLRGAEQDAEVRNMDDFSEE